MAPKIDKEGKLSLAFKDYQLLPVESLNQKDIDKIKILDLSYNELTSVRELVNFRNLTTLVLDHNRINSHSKFPFLPSLTTLWVNHNGIKNLSVFIEHLAQTLPNLRELCLMNNEAAPSYFNGGSLQEHTEYRHFVIPYFPKLRTLDDSPVSEEERQIARKTTTYKFTTKAGKR